ncbi:MAG: hypothetical protein P1P90_05005 [Patescibacteria group bacterium]|nr:hypothetical protein [Patescibacteria group bacterium]
MNTRTATLFVSCFLFLVSLSGCMSAGGSYNLHDESPYHKHTIEETTDSRGQTSTVETRIVKPEAQQRYMSRGFVDSTGVTPGSMGSSIYLSPPKAHVNCTVGEDGNGRTIQICPTRDGVVPLVVDPNGTANEYNADHDLLINTAATVQDLVECQNENNCR